MPRSCQHIIIEDCKNRLVVLTAEWLPWLHGLLWYQLTTREVLSLFISSSFPCSRIRKVEETTKQQAQSIGGWFNSRNVISVAVWFQVVAHLLLSQFRVKSPVQWKFLANNELGCKWKSLYICQKGVELKLYSCVIGWTLEKYLCAMG